MCLTEFDEIKYGEILREEGREEGLEQGLEALVDSLKNFLPDFESLYATVIKNEAFKNVSREQVEKYYKF